MALLSLSGVEKVFRRGSEAVRALAGIDLDLDTGEFVGLVGPSGSGKSTLLHLAGGLDSPDAGTVTLDGRDLAALTAAERACVRRREIGFVFQFFHLVPTLTVVENVALPLVLDGGRGATGVAGELVERVGLGHRRDHRPAELSGGEMQRAAIARALVARPKLVLADEPTGNLDSATGAAILELLVEQVSGYGAAMLVATHDPSVAALAVRMLSLRDGHIEALESPARRPRRRPR